MKFMDKAEDEKNVMNVSKNDDTIAFYIFSKEMYNDCIVVHL